MSEKEYVAKPKHPISIRTENNGLSARLFDAGVLEVESPNTIGIQIERLGPDYGFPFPEGAVYKIFTYIPHEQDIESCGTGSIFINGKGEYLLPDGTNLSKKKD